MTYKIIGRDYVNRKQKMRKLRRRVFVFPWQRFLFFAAVAGQVRKTETLTAQKPRGGTK